MLSSRSRLLRYRCLTQSRGYTHRVGDIPRIKCKDIGRDLLQAKVGLCFSQARAYSSTNTLLLGRCKCSAIMRGMNNTLGALVEWYDELVNYIH